MIDLAPDVLDDRAAREQAIDTSGSVLVQAPAGSGKTELLAMRFLMLLAEVKEPDEILAITFTRYATAEIRHRIIAKLEEARVSMESGTMPEGEDNSSLLIAQAALANSIKRGWRLLEQPQRLNIQSIDSLCLRIAHQSPLSVRPGGVLRPTTVAAPLYRQAALQTFDRLGGDDKELNTALQELLLLRDSNLASCEALLAGMLATRDQWTHAFPLTGEIDWERARARLEEPLRREVYRVLGEAHGLLFAQPALTRELMALTDYACGNLEPDHDLHRLAGLAALPPPTLEFAGQWRCLCGFLLTEQSGARRRFNISNGFPRQGKEQKARIRDLVQKLDQIGLFDWLREIRALPPPTYTDRQWNSLRHIFVALRHAVAELGSVFAEHGVVDIMEISIAALEALNGDLAGTAMVKGTHHLLVDEFQDTSRRQHDLLGALLRSWSADAEAEKPRTLFFVGDPMQSIYMFRQADVELFELVRRQGFAAGDKFLPLKKLQLKTNFRSNAGVVKPLNRMFDAVFPYGAKTGAAAVDFLPGVPANSDEPEGAYTVHASFVAAKEKSSEGDPSLDDSETAPEIDPRQSETEEVLNILRRHLPAIEKARLYDEEFTVAVLGRAKNHLVPIAAALRGEGISFRAIELETLGQRQEILDLQSLTRALLHPMDRIAWLALLRAPWCGLELRDLHLLCGTDEHQFGGGAVSRQIEEHLHLLGDEPRERVSRVRSVLQAALGNRHRQSSFSSWIERTWNSLGGPACVDEAGYENARQYFRMLEQVTPDGIEATGDAMERQLNRLFASPDPSVGERCGIQLMTMHKAKGLGFNVVLLPGLHRTTRSYTPTLIRYLERATEEGTELLVAPIDDAGDETSPLNRWVRRQKENREAEERKRLLYVACTRAREELHLFASATVTNKGPGSKPGSLLRSAWPALKGYFEEKYAELNSAQPAGKVLDFPSPPVQDHSVSGVLDALAAGSGGSRIYRLPPHGRPSPIASNLLWRGMQAISIPAEDEDEGQRPQGSRSSRILGTTVHALFERAARLFDQGQTEANLRSVLPLFRAQATSLTRNEGLSPQEAESIARNAVQALEMALADPVGLWILGSHHEAQTESSWTGVIDGVPRTLRIDRSFRAGPDPLSEGENCLWVIDYKTATHGPSGIAEFLETEKRQYAEQLQSYAEIMRFAHGVQSQLRLGLYYPFLPRLV